MSILKKVKCQGQKVKYQQKDLITKNIHEHYIKSSSIHFLKVISKDKVFKQWVKLQGQGHG